MDRSPESRQELAAWATLASLRLPINPSQVVEVFGSALPLFRRPASELRARLPWTRSQLERVAAANPSSMLPVLERFEARGISLIPYPDESYPPLLRQIPRAPAALWCRGNWETLHAPLIAIVGSRKPTSYGLRVASLLARDLVNSGIGIVSGGAYGIDAAAHEGALDGGGVSIAVFGTGIDRTYPRAHRDLYVQLAKQGACISEFAPGSAPRPEHFPIRNRLISGLSLGVVVVEAGPKSGALITAHFAVEHNREVFAVPGDIGRATSIGCNCLIQDGARLITRADDIIEEIKPHLPGSQLPLQLAGKTSRQPPKELSPDCASILDLLGETPMSVDSLIRESQQEPAKVLEVLMKLELSDLVRQLPGQQFVRRVS